MLLLNNIFLSQTSSLRLNEYQQAVDTKPTFAEKVSEGKRLFKRHNKKTNQTFKEIREKLAVMSGGTVRCNYCEDSNANQIEHIFPKNYYPERCFVWENYCYSCGPCNQPKSDKFIVIDAGSQIEVDCQKLPQSVPPPNGHALLINPRFEDPSQLLFLDISNTFHFVPLSDDPVEKRRAEYTIGILGLNTRSFLVRARKVAYSGFKARLYEYVNKKIIGAPQAELNVLIEFIKSEHHQTVWFEMKRQNIPELQQLFSNAPEALTW